MSHDNVVGIEMPWHREGMLSPANAIIQTTTKVPRRSGNSPGPTPGGWS